MDTSPLPAIMEDEGRLQPIDAVETLNRRLIDTRTSTLQAQPRDTPACDEFAQ